MPLQLANPSGLVQAAQVNAQAPLGLFGAARQAQSDNATIRGQHLQNFDAQQLSDLNSLVTGASVASTIPTIEQKTQLADRLSSMVSENSMMTPAIKEYQQVLQSGNMELIAQSEQAMINLGKRLGLGQAKGVQEQFFDSLTQNMTPEQIEEARRIQLGFDPRAVGSAEQTITAKGTAEQVGETKAILGENEAFGKGVGSSSAQAIDTGFENIVKIDQSLANMDKAIALLDQGANTGAIANLFPSITAASVALQQVAGSMALDVINSVTLGAISVKELQLAQEVALPQNLSETALRDHLELRKKAQTKLKNYYTEQIEFLDEGGTVAGYIRKKKKELNNFESTTLEKLGMSQEEWAQIQKDHPDDSKMTLLQVLSGVQ